MVTKERKLDSKARHAAKRVGLSARKVRNHSGYALIDNSTNAIIEGEHFTLSAEDVIAICEERLKEQERGATSR